MKAALRNYQARMRRVLDHIDRHLDGDLDLETVSGVAAFSKFHFHRQFTATFGLSVHRYVQLARMKRASYRLAYSDAQSVTDIAMDAGYAAPDAFARAFRQRFGQSPSSFRRSPDWEAWLAAFGPLDDARSKLMQTTFASDDVTIRDVPPTPVAIIEHRGGPAPVDEPLDGGAERRRPAPEDEPDLQCLALRAASRLAGRLQRRPLCRDRPADRAERRGQSGRDSRRALRSPAVVGDTHNLEPAALYLYREWLPASGEEARDFPIYCQRLAFFDVNSYASKPSRSTKPDTARFCSNLIGEG